MTNNIPNVADLIQEKYLKEWGGLFINKYWDANKVPSYDLFDKLHEEIKKPKPEKYFKIHNFKFRFWVNRIIADLPSNLQWITFIRKSTIYIPKLDKYILVKEVERINDFRVWINYEEDIVATEYPLTRNIHGDWWFDVKPLTLEQIHNIDSCVFCPDYPNQDEYAEVINLTENIKGNFKICGIKKLEPQNSYETSPLDPIPNISDKYWAKNRKVVGGKDGLNTHSKITGFWKENHIFIDLYYSNEGNEWKIWDDEKLLAFVLLPNLPHHQGKYTILNRREFINIHEDWKRVNIDKEKEPHFKGDNNNKVLKFDDYFWNETLLKKITKHFLNQHGLYNIKCFNEPLATIQGVEKETKFYYQFKYHFSWTLELFFKDKFITKNFLVKQGIEEKEPNSLKNVFLGLTAIAGVAAGGFGIYSGYSALTASTTALTTAQKAAAIGTMVGGVGTASSGIARGLNIWNKNEINSSPLISEINEFIKRYLDYDFLSVKVELPIIAFRNYVYTINNLIYHNYFPFYNDNEVMLKTYENDIGEVVLGKIHGWVKLNNHSVFNYNNKNRWLEHLKQNEVFIYQENPKKKNKDDYLDIENSEGIFVDQNYYHVPKSKPSNNKMPWLDTSIINFPNIEIPNLNNFTEMIPQKKEWKSAKIDMTVPSVDFQAKIKEWKENTRINKEPEKKTPELKTIKTQTYLTYQEIDFQEEQLEYLKKVELPRLSTEIEQLEEKILSPTSEEEKILTEIKNIHNWFENELEEEEWEEIVEKNLNYRTIANSWDKSKFPRLEGIIDLVIYMLGSFNVDKKKLPKPHIKDIKKEYITWPHPQRPFSQELPYYLDFNLFININDERIKKQERDEKEPVLKNRQNLYPWQYEAHILTGFTQKQDKKYIKIVGSSNNSFKNKIIFQPTQGKFYYSSYLQFLKNNTGKKFRFFSDTGFEISNGKEIVENNKGWVNIEVKGFWNIELAPNQ